MSFNFARVDESVTIMGLVEFNSGLISDAEQIRLIAFPEQVCPRKQAGRVVIQKKATSTTFRNGMLTLVPL